MSSPEGDASVQRSDGWHCPSITYDEWTVAMEREMPELEPVQAETIRKIRLWLVIFMTGLLISGVTAFPLQTELRFLRSVLEAAPVRPLAEAVGLLPWIARVHDALSQTNAHFPFLAYGTDWLAFAHLVLALLFVGPCRDPRSKHMDHHVRCRRLCGSNFACPHRWARRGIPLPWRLIDCSFGVFGVIPLLRCRQLISNLEHSIHP
jgi:hypothetical protein